MDQIRTAGDLRGFLADIMVSIRDGKLSPTQAQAISKVAAQINQSLAVEVNTALQLERMGKDRPIAGSMQIGSALGDGAPALSAPHVEPEQDDSDEEDASEKWAEAAVRHVEKFTTEVEVQKFITGHCDSLEELMETRPELHAQITAAVNEATERVRPSETARIDHSLRDDLEWCEQCDMRVAPEDAVGCKSKYCSLKVRSEAA